jgi:hypothetical protein
MIYTMMEVAFRSIFYEEKWISRMSANQIGWNRGYVINPSLWCKLVFYIIGTGFIFIYTKKERVLDEFPGYYFEIAKFLGQTKMYHRATL